MPSHFPTAKLGDLVRVGRNRVDPANLHPDTKLTHWSIPALDEHGGPEVETAAEIGSHKFKVEDDAVLLSLLNPRIPRFAIARGTDDSVCSTEFAVLSPKNDLLLSFLLLCVSSVPFMSRLTSVAQGTTKSRERAKLKDVLDISLPIPPLSEQRRIVDLVGSVDSYIDALRVQADSARTTRTSLLHELLNAGGDDWTDAVLSDLLRRSIGGVWGSEEGSEEVDITVVRSTEFTSSGYLNFATGVRRSCTARQLASRELQEGDILLEKSGGGPKQPVGRVVYVTDEIPKGTVCANFVQLVSPDPEAVCPGFVFLLMWLWHSEGRTLGYQAQTTGIRNLRTKDYLAQTIRVPPRGEQEAVVELVTSVDELTETSETTLVSAIQLRAALLAELLSGDHEIPESYDELLEAS